MAQLIEARRRSDGPIDPEVVLDDYPAPLASAIFESSYAEGMLMVACADALKLGARRRTTKVADDKRLLRQDYPYLSDSEVSDLAEKWGSSEWMDTLRRNGVKSALEGKPSLRAQCPSRFFPVSRQMVSWWRGDLDYKWCLKFLGGLAYDKITPQKSQRPSPRHRQWA